MTAVLAIVADDGATLSPARQALADHLAQLAEAETARTQAHAPMDRIRPELQTAQRTVTEAKLALAAIDGVESNDLRDWAVAGADGQKPAPRHEERQACEQRLTRARQRLEIVQRASADLQPAIQAANDAAAALASMTPALIAEVLAAEHGAIIDHLRAMRADLALAEATEAGLLRHLSQIVPLHTNSGLSESARHRLAILGERAIAARATLADPFPTHGMVDDFSRPMARFRTCTRSRRRRRASVASRRNREQCDP